MMVAVNQCTVYIPGLSPSEPEWQWPEQAGLGPVADYLQHGRQKTVATVELTHPDYADDPQARVLAALGVAEPEKYLHAVNYASGEQPDNLTWMACFDPVHLKAETDHAIVLGRRFLQPTAEELAAIFSTINPFLQADGLVLWQSAGQVYLGGRADARFDLTTDELTPLAHALNRNAGVFIKPGCGDGAWQRLQTELQMLLYSHPVNHKRAVQGQPEINGFWPHAPVRLPAEVQTAPLADLTVLTDAPLLRQVIAGAGVLEPSSLNQAAEQRQAFSLLVTEPGWCRLEGDVAGYHAALNRLDQMLDESGVERLLIHNTHGTAWQRPAGLQRFWQRLVPRRGR